MRIPSGRSVIIPSGAISIGPAFAELFMATLTPSVLKIEFIYDIDRANLSLTLFKMSMVSR